MKLIVRSLTSNVELRTFNGAKMAFLEEERRVHGRRGLLDVGEVAAARLSHLVVPRSKEHDLRDRDAIVRLLQGGAGYLIHLAGVVGGIGENRGQWRSSTTCHHGDFNLWNMPGNSV